MRCEWKKRCPCYHSFWWDGSITEWIVLARKWSAEERWWIKGVTLSSAPKIAMTFYHKWMGNSFWREAKKWKQRLQWQTGPSSLTTLTSCSFRLERWTPKPSYNLRVPSLLVIPTRGSVLFSWDPVAFRGVRRTRSVFLMMLKATDGVQFLDPQQQWEYHSLRIWKEV